MKRVSRTIGLALTLLFLSACGNETAETPAEAKPNETVQVVTDDTVGVSLTAPKDWLVEHDEFTDGTYGFVLVDHAGSGAHALQPKLRVALVDGATPEQIEALVEAKLAEYPGLELTQTDVTVGGAAGVAVSGLPAPEGQYTLAYVGTQGRVYHVGVWQGLSAETQSLFDALTFTAPLQPLQALNLPDMETYLKSQGLPEVGQEVELDYSRTGGASLAEASWEDNEAEPALEAQARRCAAQPRGLRWQTQWINDTTALGRGFSRLGSSGGGFFNEGFHIGCDARVRGSYGQRYAIDYPLSRGAKLYSAIPGRVTFAGRSNDAYRSLGNFVDVRTTVGGASYTSRSAHLSRLGVRKGQVISKARLPYVVIGRVGTTGTSTGPHLHAAVFKNARVDSLGRAYHGVSVRPRKMRCFGCNSRQYDVGAKGAGGFYTKFYRARLLKY